MWKISFFFCFMKEIHLRNMYIYLMNFLYVHRKREKNGKLIIKKMSPGREIEAGKLFAQFTT